MSGAKGGISPVLSLEFEKKGTYLSLNCQSSSGMEDKERRLWLGWKLEELGDCSHEVGTRKKFPVGSRISDGGFTSDDLSNK